MPLCSGYDSSPVFSTQEEIEAEDSPEEEGKTPITLAPELAEEVCQSSSAESESSRMPNRRKQIHRIAFSTIFQQ